MCRAYMTSSRKTMPQCTHFVESSSCVLLSTFSVFTTINGPSSFTLKGDLILSFEAPLDADPGLECFIAKSRGMSLSDPTVEY
ncbi:hypothetical protein GDO78_012336 [Eleutherodactylus coqui]|uniref:Uncharacterized protein n=1 Tax=Eleutherodactylus coqui TaxID=57060 RepID=A0A8J6K482_ELECQ|nr:hypothetical protein GDO78_012336 [Eleutherodactylus coqui]